MSAPEVTAVIPVWNGRALLERLLETLRAQTHPAAEVLVVDNGSTDGSAEAAERQGARVLRMGQNTGFSRAVNRGIRECRTEWLAIVNTDVELAPDWLARLAGALGEGTAWFAAGKILRAAQPDLLDGTYDLVCRGGGAWRAGHGRADGPEFSLRREIRFAPGTAALFRAALFDKVGLLDETFESYLEDVEFGLRCALEGFGGIYVPEAVARHRGSATLGRWHPETVRRIARNQVLLVAKHYPGSLLRRFAWPILVAQALWGLVALRHGAFVAWLRGKAAGLRSFHGHRTATVRERPEALRRILAEGEREIRRLQAKTGFDPYWRWYFRLTGGGTR